MNTNLLLEIANEFGTPTYVYDSEKIKSQYLRLKNAFKRVKDLQINYAVKASSNISILRSEFLDNVNTAGPYDTTNEDTPLVANFTANSSLYFKKFEKEGLFN